MQLKIHMTSKFMMLIKGFWPLLQVWNKEKWDHTRHAQLVTFFRIDCGSGIDFVILCFWATNFNPQSPTSYQHMTNTRVLFCRVIDESVQNVNLNCEVWILTIMCTGIGISTELQTAEPSAWKRMPKLINQRPAWARLQTFTSTDQSVGQDFAEFLLASFKFQISESTNMIRLKQRSKPQRCRGSSFPCPDRRCLQCIGKHCPLIHHCIHCFPTSLSNRPSFVH